MKQDFLYAAMQDYKALKVLTKHGIPITNTIGYIAEQSCEKFLKHLIYQIKGTDYRIPVKKRRDLHSLRNLSQILSDNCNINIPFESRMNLDLISNMYRDTRYPDTQYYHDLSREEANLCLRTVTDIKMFTLATIKELEIDAAQQEYDLERG